MNPAANPQASPTVLVIDDDEIMRDLMTDWLEAAGYRVVKAASCEDLKEHITSLRPAVVVTDMFMPGACGSAAIERIKEAMPGVAIIAVSGNFNSGWRLCGRNATPAGANRALAKPVQRSDFLQAIAELAGPAAAR